MMERKETGSCKIGSPPNRILYNEENHQQQSEGLQTSKDAKIKTHFQQVWKIKIKEPAKSNKL